MAAGFFQPEGRRLSKAAVTALMLPFFSVIALVFLWPLLSLLSLSVLEPEPTLAHYQRAIDNPVYARVLWRTLVIALWVSAVSLLLAFPVALLMARSEGPKLAFITACILLPFWSSVLVRTAAWSVLLQRKGLINEGMQGIGLTAEPLKLLYTQGAVVVAMVHVLMPFMVLPIYGALRNIPADYARAAAICGAPPWRGFLHVTLPLALPGVIGGFILVFLTALGYFITPSLLGSPKEMMISTLISQQIREHLDWPFAAALVGLLTLFVTAITLVFSRLFGFDRMLGGRK
ncbi:ABC transporter permease [Falsigemmobacter faecalis]|uniref:ABC transporter permease n=1 Tax=Falsigemmobacter faecalis TaxID=2488730 RepID=A0A3P3DQB8_9RHOB|nr:ABC transporter permease [Falsigemmobacter faecalis]RRH76134.1 ABC transporter permease [Falsigemmobacter faecalis]